MHRFFSVLHERVKPSGVLTIFVYVDLTFNQVTHVFDALCKTSGKAKEDMECLYDQMMKIFAIDRKSRPAIILYRLQDAFFQMIS